MGGYVVLLDKVYQLNKSNGSFSCWFILLGNLLQKQPSTKAEVPHEKMPKIAIFGSTNHQP